MQNNDDLMDYYGKYGKQAPKGKATEQATMTANTKAIEKKFADLMRAVGSEEKQLKIHRKVARVVKKALRRQITDYDKIIRVRRSRGQDIDIQPGTLKRSVASWRLRGETSYWVGPRVTGRKDMRDGWFAGIVESGLQEFGPGKNKGAFERGKREANAKAVRLLENEYKAVIKKAAR